MMSPFAVLKQYGIVKFCQLAFTELWRILVLQPVFGSYSQHGEDLVLEKIFGDKKDGFFVDIGAHEPVRLNNTYKLYKKGWRGVNIDADPGCIERFQALRPDDININVGIGPKEGTLKFYRFFAHALSTFSEEKAQEYEQKGHKLDKTLDIPVVQITKVFEKYTSGKTVDFMSLDVEGLDLMVLQTNDWTKFKPKVICVETGGYEGEMEEDEATAIDKLLKSVGYRLLNQNPVNSIYVVVA